MTSCRFRGNHVWNNWYSIHFGGSHNKPAVISFVCYSPHFVLYLLYIMWHIYNFVLPIIFIIITWNDNRILIYVENQCKTTKNDEYYMIFVDIFSVFSKKVYLLFLSVFCIRIYKLVLNIHINITGISFY